MSTPKEDPYYDSSELSKFQDMIRTTDERIFKNVIQEIRQLFTSAYSVAYGDNEPTTQFSHSVQQLS